ncbi:MAG TPA: hypothetical protein DDW55_01975 [Gammaproteobacteria bacterium]|nr:hypothetical protein [Gammaproteobacteria bacterium]
MDSTLEYIFFHQSVSDKLCSYIDNLGIAYQVKEDDDIITVSHDDDLDDTLLDKIENRYDELFDEESRLVNNPDNLDEELERDVVGVGVELADGRLIQVRLAPGITKRILTVLSTEELRVMANEIALQVENPIDGPLCKGEKKRS